MFTVVLQNSSSKKFGKIHKVNKFRLFSFSDMRKINYLITCSTCKQTFFYQKLLWLIKSDDYSYLPTWYIWDIWYFFITDSIMFYTGWVHENCLDISNFVRKEIIRYVYSVREMRLVSLFGYEISQFLHHVQPPEVNDSTSTKKDRLGVFTWGAFKIFVFYNFLPEKKTASVSIGRCLYENWLYDSVLLWRRIKAQ